MTMAQMVIIQVINDINWWKVLCKLDSLLSVGEVGLRQSNHSYQLAASISDNNHGASSAYSHVDLSNDIPNSISNGYDLSAGAAPTGYSMSSALSNQSNFMDSQGSASNNPNNGATYNQSGVFNNSNASMIPSSLTNPPPPGKVVRIPILLTLLLNSSCTSRIHCSYQWRHCGQHKADYILYGFVLRSTA